MPFKRTGAYELFIMTYAMMTFSVATAWHSLEDVFALPIKTLCNINDIEKKNLFCLLEKTPNGNFASTKLDLKFSSFLLVIVNIQENDNY